MPVYVYSPSTVTNTVLSGVKAYVEVPSQLNVCAPESLSEMLAAICGKAKDVVANSDKRTILSILTSPSMKLLAKAFVDWLVESTDRVQNVDLNEWSGCFHDNE